MRYRLRWRLNSQGKRVYYPEYFRSDGPGATPQTSGETPNAAEPQTPQGSGCGCGTLLLLLVLLLGGGVVLVHRYAPDWFDKARDLLKNATGQSSQSTPAESATDQPDAAQPQPEPEPAAPATPPARPRVKDDGNRLFIPR